MGDRYNSSGRADARQADERDVNTGGRREFQESRWADEGGSAQHYRHTDESGPEQQHDPGPQVRAARDSRAATAEENRSWRRFDNTYGANFGSSFDGKRQN